MFTEKLSSSTSSFARGPAQLLPGSRSHSQHSRTADSQLRENAGSPAPPIAPSTSSGGSSKVHTSPSKVRHIVVHKPCLLPAVLQWAYPGIKFSAYGAIST